MHRPEETTDRVPADPSAGDPSEGAQRPGSGGDGGGSDGSTARLPQPRWWTFLVVLLVVALIISFFIPRRSDIPYDFFLRQVEAGNVEWVALGDTVAEGEFIEPPPEPEWGKERSRVATPVGKEHAESSSGTTKEGGAKPAKGTSSSRRKLYKSFRVVLGPQFSRVELEKLLREHGIPFRYREPGIGQSIWMALFLILPLVLLVWLFVSMRRARDPFGGGGFFNNFMRSPARQYRPEQGVVTFQDVAGIENVKAELQEIVEYLKNPARFQKLGGRVPKGVLLNGPPGTGKTLLARAVAGEANVPFYLVSGSEFIQMFVGVGAGRVRDLFRTAKEHAPSIIFIDEIDAVGRQRGAGFGGGHDEREQTLNQILSEMDGFTPADSVIVLAATNRPDVLDPALLRPGRFDRHITVDRPTRKGRFEIFKVHVRHVPLDDDVDLQRLADGTVGLTGADIRNIVNEAALWAARNRKTRVSMADFEYARDKILMGPKREEVLTEEEKEKTAYHEAGHALTAWKLSGTQRVHKVSVIPRGRALGATQVLPTEDRVSVSRSEVIDRLVMLLGGRAAEQIVYGETTAGAENDLEQATSLARRMVTHWGMSDKLGPVSFKLDNDDPFLGREYQRQREVSERTLQEIDEEVASLLRGAEERAEALLQEHRSDPERLVQRLLEQEELTEAEIDELIGPPVAPRPKRRTSRSDRDESATSEPTDSASPVPRREAES